MGKAKFINTDKQVNYIKKNYLKLSSNDIGSKLGCNGCVIKRYMKANGLFVSKEVSRSFAISKARNRTSFNHSEDKFIKKHYLILPIKNLADKIGRSYTGVMCRLRQMGLTVPPEIIERNKQVGRKKPGDVSHNKGRRQVDYMSSESIARTASTRFKAGDKPHNTYNQDGVIVVRKDKDGYDYKYVRVSLGKWMPLHRHNWELVNGSIPKGHCLWCTGPDRLNCDVTNWELITRKENYSRNNGNIKLTDNAVARYMATKSKKVDKQLQEEFLQHPDLITLKRNQLILNRTINGKATN